MLALAFTVPAQAAMRVALVIGNDRYANLAAEKQLSRAASDATAVAAKLQGLGFEVVLRTNASRFQMLQALDQATRAVEPGGSVVVFFAGHGVEIDGSNYLVASDSPSPADASVQLLKNEALSLDQVMSDLGRAGAKTNVVILDACRDNPYSDGRGRSLGAERGLERVDPPSGFFVLYSAGRGQTALDRLNNDADPNSVYTRVLLRHLTDRITLVDLAKTLQQEVSALARRANHDQMPAYYDQLDGRPMLTGESQVAGIAQPSPASPDPMAMEFAYWTASNCAAGDLDGCRAYQRKYGQGGQFADLATLRLRPAPAQDANAAARAAIDAISDADWSTRHGDDLLRQTLTLASFAQIEALARTGDPRAETLSGMAFDLAMGGQAQDYAQALTWYQKAAAQGFARAEMDVGHLYGNGQGLAQDYVQAMTWYRKAADQGNALAQGNIGALYQDGLGVTQDYVQAMSWYQKAAAQQEVWAQTQIGLLYDNGQGVSQDYKQAMAWYRKAADKNYAPAQSLIGLLYQNGEGVAQDFGQAMNWYRKAVEQNDAQAQSLIGLLYDNGQGVTQDYGQAMIWYRKSADQGYAAAQYYIGILFDVGQGVAQDYGQAMQWYRKAADQGLPEAQSNIGVLYQYGRGVKQDYAQAMAWYRKGADLGDATAQNNIGVLYHNSLGVTQDFAQAMAWYRKAADRGYALAQRNIAVLYENGLGVPKDQAQARIWYGKAASGGDDVAKQWLAAHAS
jgi:TPR repeat protein